MADFYKCSTPQSVVGISDKNVALFVDYSSCIADGMLSVFYQAMVSPLTATDPEFWSIKGDVIELEQGNIYSLLNNVRAVNYAALDKAVEQMADRDGESVLLTDGELFTQTITANNPNNPYMRSGFKKWLLKGHDIHIIAEPYVERYRGRYFDKKRFYILFTDDRINGNIYERVTEIVNLKQYPDVKEFHIGGNYPWVMPESGVASVPNPVVAAEMTPSTPYGYFEIQDWQVDWKNIVDLIFTGYDDQGRPLPNGDKLIGGLRVDKNAFGCYRITDVDVRVTNINAAYNDFYNKRELGIKVKAKDLSATNEIQNFIVVDHQLFKKGEEQGVVDLYFDINNFAPTTEDLDGKPFNYFKIEIVVKDLENTLGSSLDMFNFASIVNAGNTNVSVSESLKNCVFDIDFINRLKGTVLYTIYVKSDKY